MMNEKKTEVNEHSNDEPIADFFPMSVASIFAALDGITLEEESQKLLEMEKEMRNKQ